MNCRDIESLILAERDGALTNDQLAVLSDHVAACPACRQLRTDLTTALDAYKAGLASVPAPDADEAWRDLQARLHQPAKRRPLAPVIWFGTPLAAAAALAVTFLSTSPAPPPHTSAEAKVAAVAPPPPPLYDPSVIAGADYVEAGDPNASTLVYVDKESGWLVVWAADAGAETSG
jgi:anti-sigma factor RsiW